MIEPTETESRETLDRFVVAMEQIYDEAVSHPEIVKTAPHTLGLGRVDEVAAARHPSLRWRPGLGPPPPGPGAQPGGRAGGARPPRPCAGRRPTTHPARTRHAVPHTLPPIPRP